MGGLSLTSISQRVMATVSGAKAIWQRCNRCAGVLRCSHCCSEHGCHSLPAPQIQYVEKVVEVPQIVYEERIVEVPTVETREIIKQVVSEPIISALK